MMHTLLQDAKFGLRMLRKNPGFTLVAVLTLALGIGVNSAIFSVVNAVLLRPLPYSGADRIVLLWGWDGESNRSQVSATEIEDYRRQNAVFEEVATFSDWTPVVTGLGEPERINGIQVGDGFFRVMGAQPLLGRVFTPEEQVEGKDNVVVLGHDMWQRRFGGDPNVVGKTVTMSRVSYTIVGVMPRDFPSLPSTLLDTPGEFYRPVAEAYDNNERSSRHLRAVARLRPGVTIAQAQGETDVIAARLAQQYPQDHAGSRLRVASLQADTAQNLRPTLLILLGAVGAVLLIVCANVANLLLARSAARQREISVRVALGAGAARLTRQLLTESMMLALAGGALGVLLAMWTGSAVSLLGAGVVPQLAYGPIGLDFRVLLFALGVTALTGLAFGAAPAWQARRVSLGQVLNEAGRGADGSRSRARLRGALVVAEVAVAIVLLVAAGLLLRSFHRLLQVEPGFAVADRLVMNVWLPFATYREPEKSIRFYSEFTRRLESLPGVRAAGLVSTLPFRGFDWRGMDVEGREYSPNEKPEPDAYFVTPRYLETMGIPLVRGRLLSAADDERAKFVAVINQTMARQLWPDEDPIGKRIAIGSFAGQKVDGRDPWREIVGVVGDVRHYQLDQPARMQLYLPHAQFPTTAMVLVVHSEGDPRSLVDPVRQQIASLDPGLAAFRISTMEELVSGSVATRRLAVALVGVFAALALGLGMIGIYGVISYSVSQRTREMGIRMALGAGRADVLALVVGEGARLTALGLAAGVVGAFGVARALKSVLYEIRPEDPVTFVTVPLLVVAFALLASYIPARRATRVDPMVALRYE